MLNQESFVEVKTMAVTWFEKGLEKGIEKGREEGLEKGHREMLAEQLEERFGQLSQTVQDRLNQWPAQQLNELARKICEGQVT